MKKFLVFASIVATISSCGNSADEPIAETDSLTSEIIYAWRPTVNDTTGKFDIKKTEATNMDSLSVNSIVDYINGSDTNIHLDIVKTSGDTIYLKIPTAEILTQQRGTSGAALYLSRVVYNLTELPNIHYVNFDFAQGDHASPGTYSRDSFKEY